LDRYEQNYNSLPDEVLVVIRPIYEDFTNESLLKRCLNECMQSTNESFNNLIWRMTHKHQQQCKNRENCDFPHLFNKGL